ncbi:nischarin-like [Huso huso]|uniref:Nischarin-like n=1 Tax=Huso huso TaxID=61971 RepID=A0ABR0YN16_HUSHU
MESTVFPDEANERKAVRIVGSELVVENYTVYIIEVNVGNHKWTVKHRYSDFHDLHEKLTAEKKIDKNLLPPKKIIGKNSKSLVEKRQKELEVYLQTLLAKFPLAAPKVLSCFLNFHLYEINGITAALAEDLFNKGEQLLVAGQVFCLRPLQLYAITQQLRLAKPTCANGDAKADLGHILDFTCRLKYLKVSGSSQGSVGSSNIQEHLLPFDLSVFKSLLQIEISHCEAKQIQGLPSLKPTVATMGVRYSASSMKDILVPEASEIDHWVAEGVSSDCPVTAVIPTWKNLTTLDMSHNRIMCIDESVKLIPKVEFLDLGHNELSLVENLQHLYNLIHLDLSYNKLAVLEGVHTKLGNIKTLNLAGNLLESLSGLCKLYSLVNLDLSNNKLAQFEEIKHIGSLPCLEKLTLSNNPLSIIPDYRTKVLAQFWDRASEVCLDNAAPTEKEMDTVEVLKAIQKAKEAKDRMNNTEKKISEDSKLSAASSKPNCSSFTAPPFSPSLPHPASSSQVVVCKNTAQVSNDISTPMDSAITQRCTNIHNSACEDTIQVKHTYGSSLLPINVTEQHFSCHCAEDEDNMWTNWKKTQVLPFSCVSYTATNLDFTSHLTGLIRNAMWEEHLKASKTSMHVDTVHESLSQASGDGYFEMGLDEGEHGSGCTASSDATAESCEEAGEELIQIKKVFWVYCIQVNKDLSQFASCVVLTDNLLAVFQILHQELTGNRQSVTGNMENVLTVPFIEIEAVGFDVPETCLSLKLKTSDTYWYFLSDSQNLKEIYSSLNMFNSAVKNSSSAQEFINQLLESHQLTDGDTVVKGAFAAHLLNLAEVAPCNQQIHSFPTDSSSEAKNSPYSDILSFTWQSETHQDPVYVPCLLFLTPSQLCIMKVNFVALTKKAKTLEEKRWVELIQIPLASVLLHPKQGCSSSTQPAGAFRDGHVLELMTRLKFVTAVFLLPHDKFLFLSLFSQLRASLQDVKTIAFFKVKKCHGSIKSCPLSPTMTRRTLKSSPQGLQRPHLTLSLLYPSDPLIQKLTDENQCPFHLSVSPSLHFLTGLKGNDLVEFFYNSVAEVENEDIKHLLWSSVVFYKAPDVEITACIMLSTKAVYFVLHDSAAQLGDQSLVWDWKPSDHENRDFLHSYCFTIKLNDLQSVNVGLFDQYFRVAGPSADHIISCLTRDSYSTHAFIQQLMSVLSFLAKTPSPEPVEQDFYTEFGNKSTGKMENYELVHSSRVKFIYPSEEEIGDLTYIVAEKMGDLANLHAYNILLYVLAFQVCRSKSTTSEDQHLLHPKTLILTGSDMFLFDEDYVSYPLPDFAKEPPKRDKYRLTDARRIRDLDRVLMGYQTYPQALTFVFDDLESPDLLCNLTMDHFASEFNTSGMKTRTGSVDKEVQWCIFVPGSDSREKLISLLARQWELLCSRELPLELTG